MSHIKLFGALLLVSLALSSAQIVDLHAVYDVSSQYSYWKLNSSYCIQAPVSQQDACVELIVNTLFSTRTDTSVTFTTSPPVSAVGIPAIKALYKYILYESSPGFLLNSNLVGQVCPVNLTTYYVVNQQFSFINGSLYASEYSGYDYAASVVWTGDVFKYIYEGGSFKIWKLVTTGYYQFQTFPTIGVTQSANPNINLFNMGQCCFAYNGDC
jgi:hypothetical protein